MDTIVLSGVVNFSLVVGILVYAGRKPFSAFLLSRSDGIRESIEEAEKLAKESKLTHDRWAFQMNQSSEEIQNMQREMAALVAAEKDQAFERASREADRIIREVSLVSTAETARAKKLLEQEISGVSVDLARNYLVDNIQGEISALLFSEALERVHDGRAK